MGEDFSILPLNVKDLGLQPYKETWELQKELQQQLIRGEISSTLLLCEHHPVITFGKSAKSGSLKTSLSALEEQGIEFYQVERGGDYTFHGPGQLVGYPIIDLRERKRDVGWYLRSLESVIIQTLQTLGLTGERVKDRTGVWTPTRENDKTPELRKIASIGVRLSRWCTMHGFAINVRDCSRGFSLIHPCGFDDISMSSIEQESRERGVQVASIDEVKQELIECFCQIFRFRRDVHGSSPDSFTQQNSP